MSTFCLRSRPFGERFSRYLLQSFGGKLALEIVGADRSRSELLRCLSTDGCFQAYSLALLAEDFL